MTWFGLKVISKYITFPDCTQHYAAAGGRLAPEVVAARQAMLDRCLVSVVAIGPPLSEAPPLLAFLAPADPHWDPSSQPPGTPQRPTPGHGRDAGSAASHLARAGSEHASSASSSAEAGNRCSLLT
jgi:hypothetical protein